MIGRRRRGNPHTATPVHYGVGPSTYANRHWPTEMTPDHERRRVMAERLHLVWHASPCATPAHLRCDLLTRAYAVVVALEPLVDQYLVEAVERARADLAREWGE